MTWMQRPIILPPYPRGFHQITDVILQEAPELKQFEIGLLNLFLQHTSASLTINENADPDVQIDLETGFSRIAPENFPFVHTSEGPDDMPAHIKNSLLGCSLTIPISQGQLAFGTWQGIYLCEHRNRGGPRRLVLTLHGQEGLVETAP